MNLEDAKADVLSKLSKGSYCPCCGQYAKRYKRKLNSKMAAGLCWLVRESGPKRDWVHVPEVGPKWLLKVGGTLATVAYWGLIEAKPNEDTAKRTSGIWRPTEKGRQFAFGQISVPRYVWTYNMAAEAFSKVHTAIGEALGDKFNYSELMGMDAKLPESPPPPDDYYAQFDE